MPNLIPCCRGILKADAATKTVTLRQANAPAGGNPQSVSVVIDGDKITMKGGMGPFILKRIGEDEFKKRNADPPGERVGRMTGL